MHERPWFRDPMWAYWRQRGGPTRLDHWLAREPARSGTRAAAVMAVLGVVSAVIVLDDGWSIEDAEPITVFALLVPFSYRFVREYSRRIAALIRRWDVEH